MRAIAAFLLILPGLGLTVAPAVAQGTPPAGEQQEETVVAGDPTAFQETADRPKINTKNKGGPPAAYTPSQPRSGIGIVDVELDVDTDSGTGAVYDDEMAGTESDNAGTIAADTGIGAYDDDNGTLADTASSLPLLALVGLFALFVAFVVRLLRTSRMPER